MRDPPEMTKVKAPLSWANFSDSSAVYFAKETASSSSLSNTRSSFFPVAVATSMEVASEAMVEIGLRPDRTGFGAAAKAILLAENKVLTGTRGRGIARKLPAGGARGRRWEGKTAGEGETAAVTMLKDAVGR